MRNCVTGVRVVNWWWVWVCDLIGGQVGMLFQIGGKWWSLSRTHLPPIWNSIQTCPPITSHLWIQHIHPCPSSTYNLSTVFSILLLKNVTVLVWKLLLCFRTINSLQALQHEPCCLGKYCSLSLIIFIINSSLYYILAMLLCWPGLVLLLSFYHLLLLFFTSPGSSNYST